MKCLFVIVLLVGVLVVGGVSVVLCIVIDLEVFCVLQVDGLVSVKWDDLVKFIEICQSINCFEVECGDWVQQLVCYLQIVVVKLL